MKIEEVIQIKQTNNETEVNKFLAQGYKLIKILSQKVSTEFGDEIKPVYILGLTKEQIKN